MGLLLGTGLRWFAVAERHPVIALHLLVLHPTVEGLGVLGVEHALALQVELHLLCR